MSIQDILSTSPAGKGTDMTESIGQVTLCRTGGYCDRHPDIGAQITFHVRMKQI